MPKYQHKGPWAGCALKRPVGFAPWPTRDEYEVINDVDDIEVEERRHKIMSLPDSPDDNGQSEEF